MSHHARSLIVGVVVVAGFLAACSDNDDNQDTNLASNLPGSIAASEAAQEPVVATIGQPFALSGPADGIDDTPAGMTVTISAIDTTPECEDYDPTIEDYSVQEKPFTAVEFDVVMDPNSAPITFGSPGWFRGEDPDGYVTDDLTILSGACDDAYPEFTDSDLDAGDKARGWVLLQDEKIKTGDQLIIQWPGDGNTSATITVPE